MSKRTYLFLAILALALWAIIYAFQYESGRGPQIGTLAPDFSLQNEQLQTLSLKSFRGKAVLLNFWASWCGPCQSEMPSLEALYQRYRNRGFVILGVSLDDEGWPPIREFLKQISISFPIVNDQKQMISELYQTYRVPETYLIDPEGKIVDKIVGPHDYNQEIFFKKVERILPL